MTGTIKKIITIAKNKYTLEIYPAREGCHGTEGPHFEIFSFNYKGSLYAFSNKDKINKIIKENYL